MNDNDVTMGDFKDWLWSKELYYAYVRNYDINFMSVSLWEDDKIESAVADAFDWEDSEEGFYLWADIHNKWMEYLDNPYPINVVRPDKLPDETPELPFVGATQDDFRLVAFGIADHPYSVLAHKNGLAIIWDDENETVYAIDANGFETPMSEERKRACHNLKEEVYPPLMESQIEKILDIMGIM